MTMPGFDPDRRRLFGRLGAGDLASLFRLGDQAQHRTDDLRVLSQELMAFGPDIIADTVRRAEAAPEGTELGQVATALLASREDDAP